MSDNQLIRKPNNIGIKFSIPFMNLNMNIKLKIMKKLIFVLALSFGGLIAFAQDVEELQADATDATEVIAAQDDFAEIAISELPEAVSAVLAKDYPTATISKAYVNEAKQYKLEVSLEDGTSGTLYADEEGNWIQM